MKSDPRYTSESVFHTFPWPQTPSAAQVEAVAKAGVKLRKIRAVGTKVLTGGLRALYRSLDLPGRNPLKVAHDELDTAVLAAYGFSARKDILQQLLDLNTVIAADIAAGKTVNGPGVPPTYANKAKLVSGDCFGL
jgi:hypothetical protein